MVDPKIEPASVVLVGDPFQLENSLPGQTTEIAICGDLMGATGLEPRDLRRDRCDQNVAAGFA
jgi:hypothetical protein